MPAPYNPATPTPYVPAGTAILMGIEPSSNGKRWLILACPHCGREFDADIRVDQDVALAVRKMAGHAKGAH